jgi:hypothetical protein
VGLPYLAPPTVYTHRSLYRFRKWDAVLNGPQGDGSNARLWDAQLMNADLGIHGVVSTDEVLCVGSSRETEIQVSTV